MNNTRMLVSRNKREGWYIGRIPDWYGNLGGKAGHQRTFKYHLSLRGYSIDWLFHICNDHCRPFEAHTRHN